MEFPRRFDRTLLNQDMGEFIDAVAAWQRDVEEQINIAINAKHAPIAVPITTIDIAHTQYNFAAADRVTILAGLAFGDSNTTTSASLVTAVSYTGRGVLHALTIGEFTAGGIAAATGGVKITIDGNVVCNSVALIGRQSSLRVVLGSMVIGNSTPNAVSVVSDPVGLPFNSSCLVEFLSDGTRTMTVGWKIAKKL
jgi:hypothetical protein